MTKGTAYVLGSDDAEITRLDNQAGSIAGATEALLRAAGIGGPMRVLDLGTGLGHVAFMVAGLLDPEGSVVGVDKAERLLEIAEGRRAAAGLGNVEFRHADARGFRDSEPFDAIVSRLLLFHLPDREEVLRFHLDALRPGGAMVVVEFDIGAMRAEPAVPLVETVRVWIEAAFRSAGADPRIGTQAAQLLRRAGVADVTTFGIQAYFAPSDPLGPILCAGVTRSLAPQIVAQGIADEDELGLETLQARIAEEVAARDAVVLPPAVVGAWGRAR
jgi:ubiquinone/menaquinone biosynthesis C-methylase UbiE